MPDILVIDVPMDGFPVSPVEYFLTDTITYQLPEFTVNYDICALTYSQSVTPELGLDGVSINGDPSVRELTYQFSLDGSYV